jgi:glycosyltransferase involved in cell wall biosynthesis
MYGAKQTTGIGQYIQQLTDHLFQIDQKNEYLMFMKEPEFSIFTPPTNVKKIKVTSHWYTYKEQFKLPFELKQENFDLIHYPHFNSPIFFNKKSICTIHDVTPFYFKGHKMKSSIRRWGYKKVFNNTVKKSSQIITVSNSTKKGVVDIFQVPENKIKTIYNGVDSRFKNIKDCGIINKVKEKYGITEPFIFFVGVWRNHKNIEGLISAYNLVKKQYKKPLSLVLAGQEDPHYQNIRKQINQSPYKNSIITPGFIDNNDLPALYSSAEMLVIPSFIEGFGLIAIESQKCHCPVISTNTSSLPEVLEDSALFFDPHKDIEISTQIIKLLSNNTLKQNLIEKGIKNANRFSWNKCATETLNQYNKILQKNKFSR